MRLWDIPGIHPSLRKYAPFLIYLYASLSESTPPSQNLPQPFSTMQFSQNLPLSPAWVSVHALQGIYRAYISSLSALTG